MPLGVTSGKVAANINEKCDEKGNQQANVLTKVERAGLKELLAMVKDEKVAVSKTDKSHRLSVIEIDMFS